MVNSNNSNKNKVFNNKVEDKTKSILKQEKIVKTDDLKSSISETKEKEQIQKDIKKDQEIQKKQIRKQKILWRKSSGFKKRKVSEFKFKLVQVKRITKVTKGGRRFRFMAVALAGDGKGRVGVGYGKASEIASARNKAFARAEKNIFSVPFTKTIPYEIKAKYCSSVILLKPAVEGAGIILGGSARLVIEMLGIKNICGKALGSTNKINLLKATIKALKLIRTPKQIMELRSKYE